MALAFEAPGIRDDAAYTAQVYAVALGGGMSSRLFQELRERRGLCYTIFAQAGAYEDTGLITLYAGTGAHQNPRADHADHGRAAPGRGRADPAELDRTRAQLKAGMLMGLESPSARAERLARMLSVWGRVPEIDEIVAKIDAVTAEGVRAFAEGLAARGDPALALLGPVGRRPGPRRPGEAAGGLRRACSASAAPHRLRSRRSGCGCGCRRWAIMPPGRSCRRAGEAFLRDWEPSWSSDHFSRKAFRNRVYWAWRAREEGRALALFLIRREDGRLMGAITLDNIRRGPSQSAQVGYWIGPDFARQGLMTEALASVVHHAFSVLDLSRIEAACLPENLPSRALLERSGFKYEGVAQSYLQIGGRWRNHVLYANLRGDRRGRAAAEAG